MKKPITKFSLFALLFVFASFAPATVYKYTSTEGKYTITFPSEFLTESKQGDTYSSVQTTASFENQFYFITHNVHELELTGPEELAQVSLESFVSTMGGSIKSQKKWVVNKNNGIHAIVDVDSKGLKCEYKIVIIGQIQYQITVVSPTESWNQANANKFLKSLKIKK